MFISQPGGKVAPSNADRLASSVEQTWAVGPTSASQIFLPALYPVSPMNDHAPVYVFVVARTKRPFDEI